MHWFTRFRPSRSLTLPFLMALFPTLYVGYRAATIGRSDCSALAPAGYVSGAIAVSYLFAVAVRTLVVARASDSGARFAFRPSDATLAVLAVLVGTLAVYGVATLVTTLPAWFDRTVTPVGVVVGLPFVATYAASVVVGNAIGYEPSLAVQLLALTVSLGLTGLWVFLLATLLTRRLSALAE